MHDSKCIIMPCQGWQNALYAEVSDTCCTSLSLRLKSKRHLRFDHDFSPNAAAGCLSSHMLSQTSFKPYISCFCMTKSVLTQPTVHICQHGHLSMMVSLFSQIALFKSICSAPDLHLGCGRNVACMRCRSARKRSRSSEEDGDNSEAEEQTMPVDFHGIINSAVRTHCPVPLYFALSHQVVYVMHKHTKPGKRRMLLKQASAESRI